VGWNLAPLGLLVIALGGWATFQPRDENRDLVVARDRLLAADGIVATFSPGGAEGYRFTALADGSWLWERTSGSDGGIRGDRLIYNGRQHLLKLAENCHIPLTDVREPLIPGWNVAPRLVTQRGLHRIGDTRAEYVIDAAPYHSATSAPEVLVTEVLIGVRQGTLTVHTEAVGQVARAWTGSYVVRRASSDELQAARDTISAAVASDFAEVRFIERVAGSLILTHALLGPYSVVVAEDCPDSPTQLGSAARGGQIEGLRVSPSPLRFTGGSPPLVLQAKTTRLRVRAPVELFNAEMETGNFGEVPITESGVFLVSTGPASGIAVQVLSCTAKPWFQC
jgi:hypothetical protein